MAAKLTGQKNNDSSSIVTLGMNDSTTDQAHLLSLQEWRKKLEQDVQQYNLYLQNHQKKQTQMVSTSTLTKHSSEHQLKGRTKQSQGDSQLSSNNTIDLFKKRSNINQQTNHNNSNSKITIESIGDLTNQKNKTIQKQLNNSTKRIKTQESVNKSSSQSIEGRAQLIFETQQTNENKKNKTKTTVISSDKAKQIKQNKPKSIQKSAKKQNNLEDNNNSSNKFHLDNTKVKTLQSQKSTTSFDKSYYDSGQEQSLNPIKWKIDQLENELNLGILKANSLIQPKSSAWQNLEQRLTTDEARSAMRRQQNKQQQQQYNGIDEYMMNQSLRSQGNRIIREQTGNNQSALQNQSNLDIWQSKQRDDSYFSNNQQLQSGQNGITQYGMQNSASSEIKMGNNIVHRNHGYKGDIFYQDNRIDREKNMDLMNDGYDTNDATYGSNNNSSCVQGVPRRNNQTQNISKVRDESIQTDGQENEDKITGNISKRNNNGNDTSQDNIDRYYVQKKQIKQQTQQRSNLRDSSTNRLTKIPRSNTSSDVSSFSNPSEGTGSSLDQSGSNDGELDEQQGQQLCNHRKFVQQYQQINHCCLCYNRYKNNQYSIKQLKGCSHLDQKFKYQQDYSGIGDDCCHRDFSNHRHKCQCQQFKDNYQSSNNSRHKSNADQSNGQNSFVHQRTSQESTPKQHGLNYSIPSTGQYLQVPSSSLHKHQQQQQQHNSPFDQQPYDSLQRILSLSPSLSLHKQKPMVNELPRSLSQSQLLLSQLKSKGYQRSSQLKSEQMEQHLLELSKQVEDLKMSITKKKCINQASQLSLIQLNANTAQNNDKCVSANRMVTNSSINNKSRIRGQDEENRDDRIQQDSSRLKNISTTLQDINNIVQGNNLNKNRVKTEETPYQSAIHSHRINTLEKESFNGNNYQTNEQYLQQSINSIRDNNNNNTRQQQQPAILSSNNQIGRSQKKEQYQQQNQSRNQNNHHKQQEYFNEVISPLSERDILQKNEQQKKLLEERLDRQQYQSAKLSGSSSSTPRISSSSQQSTIKDKFKAVEEIISRSRKQSQENLRNFQLKQEQIDNIILKSSASPTNRTVYSENVNSMRYPIIANADQVGVSPRSTFSSSSSAVPGATSKIGQSSDKNNQMYNNNNNRFPLSVDQRQLKQEKSSIAQRLDVHDRNGQMNSPSSLTDQGFSKDLDVVEKEQMQQQHYSRRIGSSIFECNNEELVQQFQSIMTNNPQNEGDNQYENQFSQTQFLNNNNNISGKDNNNNNTNGNIFQYPRTDKKDKQTKNNNNDNNSNSNNNSKVNLKSPSDLEQNNYYSPIAGKQLFTEHIKVLSEYPERQQQQQFVQVNRRDQGGQVQYEKQDQQKMQYQYDQQDNLTVSPKQFNKSTIPNITTQYKSDQVMSKIYPQSFSNSKQQPSQQEQHFSASNQKNQQEYDINDTDYQQDQSVSQSRQQMENNIGAFGNELAKLKNSKLDKLGNQSQQEDIKGQSNQSGSQNNYEQTLPGSDLKQQQQQSDRMNQRKYGSPDNNNDMYGQQGSRDNISGYQQIITPTMANLKLNNEDGQETQINQSERQRQIINSNKQQELSNSIQDKYRQDSDSYAQVYHEDNINQKQPTSIPKLNNHSYNDYEDEDQEVNRNDNNHDDDGQSNNQYQKEGQYIVEQSKRQMPMKNQNQRNEQIIKNQRTDMNEIDQENRDQLSERQQQAFQKGFQFTLNQGDPQEQRFNEEKDEQDYQRKNQLPQRIIDQGNEGRGDERIQQNKQEQYQQLEDEEDDEQDNNNDKNSNFIQSQVREENQGKRQQINQNQSPIKESNSSTKNSKNNNNSNLKESINNAQGNSEYDQSTLLAQNHQHRNDHPQDFQKYNDNPENQQQQRILIQQQQPSNTSQKNQLSNLKGDEQTNLQQGNKILSKVSSQGFNNTAIQLIQQQRVQQLNQAQQDNNIQTLNEQTPMNQRQQQKQGQQQNTQEDPYQGNNSYNNYDDQSNRIQSDSLNKLDIQGNNSSNNYANNTSTTQNQPENTQRSLNNNQQIMNSQSKYNPNIPTNSQYTQGNANNLSIQELNEFIKQEQSINQVPPQQVNPNSRRDQPVQIDMLLFGSQGSIQSGQPSLRNSIDSNVNITPNIINYPLNQLNQEQQTQLLMTQQQQQQQEQNNNKQQLQQQQQQQPKKQADVIIYQQNQKQEDISPGKQNNEDIFRQKAQSQSSQKQPQQRNQHDEQDTAKQQQDKLFCGLDGLQNDHHNHLTEAVCGGISAAGSISNETSTPQFMNRQFNSQKKRNPFSDSPETFKEETDQKNEHLLEKLQASAQKIVQEQKSQKDNNRKKECQEKMEGNSNKKERDMQMSQQTEQQQQSTFKPLKEDGQQMQQQYGPSFQQKYPNVNPLQQADTFNNNTKDKLPIGITQSSSNSKNQYQQKYNTKDVECQSAELEQNIGRNIEFQNNPASRKEDPLIGLQEDSNGRVSSQKWTATQRQTTSNSSFPQSNASPENILVSPFNMGQEQQSSISAERQRFRNGYRNDKVIDNDISFSNEGKGDDFEKNNQGAEDLKRYVQTYEPKQLINYQKQTGVQQPELQQIIQNELILSLQQSRQLRSISNSKNSQKEGKDQKQLQQQEQLNKQYEQKNSNRRSQEPQQDTLSSSQSQNSVREQLKGGNLLEVSQQQSNSGRRNTRNDDQDDLGEFYFEEEGEGGQSERIAQSINGLNSHRHNHKGDPKKSEQNLNPNLSQSQDNYSSRRHNNNNHSFEQKQSPQQDQEDPSKQQHSIISETSSSFSKQSKNKQKQSVDSGKRLLGRRSGSGIYFNGKVNSYQQERQRKQTYSKFIAKEEENTQTRLFYDKCICFKPNCGCRDEVTDKNKSQTKRFSTLALPTE